MSIPVLTCIGHKSSSINRADQGKVKEVKVQITGNLVIFSWRWIFVYSFLRAALANWHKLGDLKQWNCVLSQSGNWWSQIRGWQGHILIKALKENRSLPFLASGDSKCSLPDDNITPICLHLHMAFSSVHSPLLLLYKDTCRWIQDRSIA